MKYSTESQDVTFSFRGTSCQWAHNINFHPMLKIWRKLIFFRNTLFQTTTSDLVVSLLNMDLN